MGSHRLHAVEWGRRRERRVIVCAHGYSGNGRDFDFLAQRLAREAHVVCPDLAGRGRSAWLPTPLAYHFPQFFSDLRALIDELGVDGVEWVGTSMGGLLGLVLAAEPRSPVRRLVLNDVGAFVPADALVAIGRNLRAPKRFASLDALEDHLRRTHRDWGPITDGQWRHLVRHGSRPVAGGYALHYDPQIASLVQPVPFAPGLSFWSAWHRVRCPVLVVRGERSSILPPAILDTMLAVKPQIEVVEVAGTGHAPSLMEARQIEVVAEFLGRTARGVLRSAA
ncbi:MAG TPA: alpha/beta hydrolase [Usitatibacter sp.]|nr:alpha/beta hydrolase [Usitatibacter sp.]